MKSNFSEALILFQTGKLNEAKNACEEILEQKNNNSQVHNLFSVLVLCFLSINVFSGLLGFQS